MPRLEIDEIVARVVTDEFGPRPGLRDPDQTESEKISRFAAKLKTKYGSLGIGDWAIRGVGRVVFGLRRASLQRSNWTRELPRWIALARKCAAGEASVPMPHPDREQFRALAGFLEHIDEGHQTRAPVDAIEAWSAVCARNAELLARSDADDAHIIRYEQLSDQALLRDVWDFLWRTHVGSDDMPARPWHV
jgi:hypothetical protein